MTDTGSPAHILIVDDSEDSADITAAFLEDGGFSRLTFARSAGEAFALVGLGTDGASVLFDLVIMDIMMPDVDGIEACARLRIHGPTRHVPILMLSAARETQALNQAFVAGANDFVAKPVSQIDLLARVRTLLRFGREQERRLLREAELEQRSITLQRGMLDAALIDSVTQLAKGMVVELTLRACWDAGRSAAMAMLKLNEFDRFMDFHGVEESERLLRKVTSLLAPEPTPAASLICYYGDGVFMIVHPGAGNDEAMRLAGENMQMVVAQAHIPHGNALESEHVSLNVLTGWGGSGELTDLTGNLLNKMAFTQRERGLYVNEN